MRRTVALFILSVVCAASLAACRGSAGTPRGEEGLDELVKALDAFTRELTESVESAPDAKAGAAEAQRLLDSRRAELSARIDALKRGPALRESEARARWLEAEVDDTQRVRQLQLKYLDASLRDPELKARLERLAEDYDALFKER